MCKHRSPAPSEPLPKKDQILVRLANGLIYSIIMWFHVCYNDPDQVQLGEHTDYGTLTLLFQRNVGGLEVQTRRGGDYVPAPPIHGTILVNIGDIRGCC